MRQTMDLNWYTQDRRRETLMLSTDPAKTIRNWAQLWNGIFSLLIEGCPNLNGTRRGQGLFEPCSLIIARWEFLGSLYVGHSKARSRTAQALAYAERFLAMP